MRQVTGCQTKGGKTAGIIGAGLLGRLLAVMLSEQGWQVTLYDRDSSQGTQSCGYVGAGMLAPASELETAEIMISQLGLASLPLWEEIIVRLPQPVFFQKKGTLIVAHHQDYPELTRFSRTLQSKLIPALKPDGMCWTLSASEIQALESALAHRFYRGIYFPEEGQIDNRQLMVALAAALEVRQVIWHENTDIQQLSPHGLHDGIQMRTFDWILDCRGLGAQKDWSELRGIRGEIIRVYAPEVTISRPVRLIHPRYPLYIVPREHHRYLIGATSIESDDSKPLTVQSALELLSAAFAVHPGFAEASILEMNVQCRPALPCHLPEIQVMEGLLRVNGLYRHGFLVSPMLATLVCQYLTHQTIAPEYASIFKFMSMEQHSERILSHAACG